MRHLGHVMNRMLAERCTGIKTVLLEGLGWWQWRAHTSTLKSCSALRRVELTPGPARKGGGAVATALGSLGLMVPGVREAIR